MTATPLVGSPPAPVPPAGPHGGDGVAVARALGLADDAVLDLSQSLNPFAPDPAPVVARHLGAVRRYPDESAATAALAAAIDVGVERLVLTNGGAEAIALVATLLGGRGQVGEPEFSLYRRHLVFDPDGPRFRSNPNNPTGVLAGPDERAEVWDEAFYAMATGAWTRGDGGAWVVGSLTKILACPGLRAGYVLAPDVESARAVASSRPAWSVNALACSALPELLGTLDVPGTARAVAAARTDLVGVLGRHGLVARPSDAPWVLVDVDGDRFPGVADTDGTPAARVRRALAVHGVVVRDCTGFGMPATVRIAVPAAAGLQHLDAALAAVLGTGAWPRHAPGADAKGRGTLRGGLFVCGTASDVGKSALVTGLCRLLARRGVSVAPFKAQNMALNSWVTDDGAEIGRAQGVQAAAAGIPAERAMNPVLLKPTGEHRSQVVVLGRPWKELDAVAFHAAKEELRSVVTESLAALRSRFDVVLCEGAGSPAEINLLDHDIVNLRLAESVGLGALLVGDIDRGGVFAALHGTLSLLPPELRALVGGLVVNKFRGDPALLAPGLGEIERRDGVPVLGVVPWLAPALLGLDSEDSLDLAQLAGPGAPDGIDAAVVRLPHLSNAPDIDGLAHEPSVSVRFVERGAELGHPDLVLLPGTKTTVADLAWLRRQGVADSLGALLHRPDGPVLLAVCGGYQMLGRTIEDDVEGRVGIVDGLGWMDHDTRFAADKVTRRRRGRVTAAAGAPTAGQLVTGYQIHHGRVRAGAGTAWLELDDGGSTTTEGSADPARRIYATSLHGLLDEDGFRRAFLAMVGAHRGRRFTPAPEGLAEARRRRFDVLADAIEEHLDVDALLRLVERGADA